MVVVRDVTLERSYQESLSTFARTVAHDLNNPLMVIEGWTDAIDDDLSGSSDPDVVRAAGQLRYVRNGVTQMREFVSDLLSHAMAADQSLQCTTLDLGEVVADIAAQRNAPGLPQGGIVVGELPSVWADPVLVRQVLDNLIGNAAKYVAPGVTPQIHVEARPSVDGWVEVAVRDNGIGIHPAQREQVFENFHRANQSGYAGTGLGLGICKRIVERHGGSIRVEGNPEGGSTFVFSLPVSSSALIASGGRSSAR
jgi:signal transduction histidine kinase